MPPAVQRDEHFLAVARYVEANALRAGLVERAEAWRWGSLWRRAQPGHAARFLVRPEAWPVTPQRDWLAAVSRPQGEKELERLRRSAYRGAPFGDAAWQERTAGRLGLESSLRPRGRPRRAEDE